MREARSKELARLAEEAMEKRGQEDAELIARYAKNGVPPTNSAPVNREQLEKLADAKREERRLEDAALIAKYVTNSSHSSAMFSPVNGELLQQASEQTTLGKK